MNTFKRLSFEELRQTAASYFKSGYWKDCANEDQVFAKIMAGQEMGFGTWASMNGITIIAGKPTLSAGLIAALIKRDNFYDYKIVELNNTRAVIEFFECGKKSGDSTFSMEDAIQAGLASKDIWKKYPRNMLFSRALTNGARLYCPTASAGISIYTPEELGDDTAAIPEIVESETAPAPAATPTATQEEMKPIEPDTTSAHLNTYRELFEEANTLFNPTNDQSLRTGLHKRWGIVWIEELVAQGIDGNLGLDDLSDGQMISTVERIRSRVLSATQQAAA